MADPSIRMYDSVDVDAIPSNAQAVAGYVDGRWPTDAELVRRMPHAFVLSISVNCETPADCLDVERGDAEGPDEVDHWLAMMERLGRHRPVLYANLSTAEGLFAPADGPERRSRCKWWSAHWTGKWHICDGHCGIGLVEPPGATQWSDRAGGRNLDVSRTTRGWLIAACSYHGDVGHHNLP